MQRCICNVSSQDNRPLAPTSVHSAFRHTLLFARPPEVRSPPRSPCQASLFNTTPPPHTPHRPRLGRASNASAPKHAPGCRVAMHASDSVARPSTQVYDSSLRFATGQPCGGQKYLVVALEAFQAVLRDIEAAVTQLPEDARRDLRARSSAYHAQASLLFRSHSPPKPSKLIEVCVPTPHLYVAPLLPPSVCGCLADIPTHAPRTAPHKRRLSACPGRSPRMPSRFRILRGVLARTRTNQIEN